MKGFYSFVFLTVIVLQVQAQNYTIDRPNRLKSLVVGLVATPEYLMCTDKAPKNENYEYEYKNKFTLGLGLDARWNFSDVLALKTGVFQSFRRYVRKELCYDCANGFNYESEFKLNYLDIPLGAAYKIINSRADLIVEGAFVTSILEKAIENRNSISGSYYDYNVKSSYNLFMGGMQLGVGTNYNLTYRLSVGLTVGYKYYFTKVTDAVPVKWGGISSIAGVYYKF